MSGNEQAEVVFWHGSDVFLPPGTILTPQPGYVARWGHTDFYPVLERHRPRACLAHCHAVFMCESDEDLDSAGGGTEWVFRVQPQGPKSRHDLNWSSAISCAVGEGATADELARLACLYWVGVPSSDPLWEWLCPTALIVAAEPF